MGSDSVIIACWKISAISIHAFREGSDAVAHPGLLGGYDFNPRSPWGERPTSIPSWLPAPLFQSTLPVGGATRRRRAAPGRKIFQSTLPVGGATDALCMTGWEIEISIHAPRGGSDRNMKTPSDGNPNFNPRSPWGERPLLIMSAISEIWISIHAPRGGSDP